MRKLTRQIVVRLPDDMHTLIVECARLEERTVAQTIRRALRIYLASEVSS